MSHIEVREQILAEALEKLIKTSSQTPQATERFVLIKEIIQQPAHEFGGMIITPFMEEFHEAMAPIYAASAEIAEDIYNMIFTVAKPFIQLGFIILEKAGPLIIALRDLLTGSPSTATRTPGEMFADGISESQQANIDYWIRRSTEGL